ncbi:SDR family NAD(P)-dependent oxidoreductase [Halobacillus sp. Marseille-Q1614]|uniref:SDR family NAD(P)-dependent oxidoreductase n=1 Tax=Halobacillus sp. Marseille-Q1614 TaxID=2709134 RepID=UPI00156F4230|nr:SDR family NAD(P)-dependent oxidoreductase [Halobacillus sp. Marseille-Q1614]
MNIFLTGSTGFLGGKLIQNLMKDTDHHVYLLVRNLGKARQLVESFSEENQKRIHILEGDITSPNCGITEETFNQLKGKIDCFYHSAALVKFDVELSDELFEINYTGTLNTLELAKELAVKKFFYISTAYTVGKKSHGVEELYPLDAEYHNPYEASKVKSEHLVFSYGNQMDVSIFRPAIIVGDSKTGEADSEFTLYGFMRALDIFKRRMMRKSDANKDEKYRVIANQEGTSNFVPVDYVADILSLAVTKAEPHTIYNITNPNPPTNYEIMKMFKEALQFEQLDLINSQGDYELSEEEKQLNGMVDIFSVYLAGNVSFRDENTQRLIEGTGVKHLNLPPQTVQMIINAYFTH